MPTLVGKSAQLRQGVLTPPNYGSASLTLSGYTFKGVSGALMQGEVVQFYLFIAQGHAGDEVNGFRGTLSGYTLSIYSGATFEATLTSPTFSSSGSNDVIGTVDLEVSGYSLDSSGTTDIWGTARLSHSGLYSWVVRGGGRASGTLARPSLASSGTTDFTGGVAKLLPTPILIVSGTVDATGQVIGVLPTLKIAPSGKISLQLPHTLIAVSGSTSILTEGGQVLIDYEAYSFSLMEDKDGVTRAYTTRYTNYPFDRIVRFNNVYYGVASDGLYELDGDTFDGSPIVAVVQTAPTDFKAIEQKRPFSLYIGGRVGADFKVSVVSAEKDTNVYTYRPVDKTGARNYRTLFGRGIKARYLAYSLTNTDGGDFEIDDLSPEVTVLKRTA